MRDCALQFCGFEAEGARLAFVDDVAGSIDEVDAVGPGSVVLLGGVAEFVEHGRDFDAEFAHASAGDEGAVFLRFGADEEDFLLQIALCLPDIGGMRLGDVND